MYKNILKTSALIFTLLFSLTALSGCAKDSEKPYFPPDETLITMSENCISVEYGSETGLNDSVKTTNDIIYYENRETYDSGYAYGEGTAEEKHTADEAAANTVVNITKAGTYRVTGSLKGQIRVDLGENAFTDPDAVVTLILDNADITCDVAPAILFMNVYECDNNWSAENAHYNIDTTSAGANLIITDGSENTVNGSHVARIYKDGGREKKLWKQDGAIYSYMSMNISGEKDGSGILNLTADNEGLDTELHLTINSGNINIRSGNDGINTNEDGVSVTTINGGNIHIIAGLGAEGDGVDSNGWLVINGGTVVSNANPAADAGLDSDMGSFINGGTVIALGSTMDWAESDSEQITMNLQFAEYKASDSAIIISKEDGTVVFAYDLSEDEVVGENIRQYMGAVISSPDLVLEENYNVYIGGTIAGEESAGIYDIATVTGFDGAVKQAYTGTDVRRGFGGGMMRPDKEWNGEIPEGIELDENGRPVIPDGFEIPESEKCEGMMRPDLRQDREIPENMELDENGRPVIPDGFEIPEGGFPGMHVELGDRSNENTIFFMQDKVNFFSGLADASLTE
ncbi:MAG: carbohydrate-binding domain-containing protein [Lachnospiraceae bacterium]|nr:carbohydrate-binding domain-containing protein [Lachnospiraceae bacterium]